MRVKIKGNRKKSRSSYGDWYYVIVRLDRRNTDPDALTDEIWAFINEDWFQEPIDLEFEGELQELCPTLPLSKVRWYKYIGRDQYGPI